ncbi:MAG: Gfo/Idh/MocA family oxidoreductase [Candidatus Edwardsbacteria bacterium]|jgi:predicted dehydrogenase|nr:Gfo/Idh/MocA family oxidoreductase [Candidatus Edwardsbacteria bacterium]
MPDLSLAIAGCGQWGSNHVRTFGNMPGVRVKYLVDADPKRLARAREIVRPAAATADFTAALKDPEVAAAVIATNSESHHSLAKQALLAGKHVLVEKPLALSVRDAEDLVETAASHKLVLMVGHLLLYHPAVRHLKALLDGGDLGQILYLYSTRVNLGAIRRNENALWSLAPHDISVMLYLLGKNPERAMANGKSYLQQGIEDVVFFLLDFPGGQMAQAQVSWLDPHKIRKFTVVGTRKMAAFDDMEATEKIKVYNKGVNEEIRYGSYDEVLTLREGDINIPYFKMTEPLRVEDAHFVECVRQGTKPLSDGQNGLDVVRILEAVTRSLKTGQPVTI